MNVGRTNVINSTSLSIDDIYPIGSVYMSVMNNSPALLFGGSWEKIKDTFIVSVGDVYALGNIGGSTTHSHTTAGHTLTIAEMPSHTHVQDSHRHTLTGNWSSGSGSKQAYTYGPNRKLLNERATDYQAPANQNTGGGGSHSHGDTGSASSMPPYLVVYMWKRIE